MYCLTPMPSGFADCHAPAGSCGKKTKTSSKKSICITCARWSTVMLQITDVMKHTNFSAIHIVYETYVVTSQSWR